MLRYYISTLLQRHMQTFPLGTMGVNFLGCLVLSVFMYLSEYRGLFSDQFRIFLAIGLLGAFTTMSTFSYESFKLLEHNEMALFSVNIFGTMFIAFAAIYIGKIIAISIGRI